MAATVISYMLGDASFLQPVLQRSLSETVIEADKDFVCRFAVLIAIIIAYQLQSLVTDGVVHQFLRLLHAEGDVHGAVAIRLDLVPSQLFDVALAESRQTRKEESLLQHLRGTGGVGKIDKFLTRQVLFLRGDGVDALQEAIGILHNLVLAVGSMEHSPKC